MVLPELSLHPDALVPDVSVQLRVSAPVEALARLYVTPEGETAVIV